MCLRQSLRPQGLVHGRNAPTTAGWSELPKSVGRDFVSPAPSQGLLCQSQQIPVTLPRPEYIPVWFASRIICFLLGDLVSLFSMEEQLKKKNLGRKQIQLESNVEAGEARIRKGDPLATLYQCLQKLSAIVTTGLYHLLLPTV